MHRVTERKARNSHDGFDCQKPIWEGHSGIFSDAKYHAGDQRYGFGLLSLGA